jgi:hypothetical protein
MDIENLRRQIKRNCDISDARYWGYYSICGMLMRLRELYRSEHSLMPWESIPKEEIGDWITSREDLWSDLEDDDIQPIEMKGNYYNPYDIEGLNLYLNKEGLVYGGGYGRFNKPTFFLSVLNRKGELHGHQIYYVGKELCRDLSTSSAMLSQKYIFIRMKPLETLLWEKFQELRSRKTKGALGNAFSFYEIHDSDIPSEELNRKIESLSSHVSDVLLHHELGEAHENEDAEEWFSILSINNDRWADYYLRGIQDLLADTSIVGTLQAIIAKKEPALLYFYIALLDAIRKELCPELMMAFQNFIEKGAWSFIEEMRSIGYGRAHKLKRAVIGIWKKEEDIHRVIEYLRSTLGRQPMST